jgi:signal transduction histidine kinase
VLLEIADNGVGFDSSASPAGGFGLRGMGERAVRSGVQLDVVSSPGEGTTVRAVVPG